MKKYHQLLLFIISVVSLTLFLIYRHEYNRLHYVLEVFNFFGQPCNISTLHQTDYILNHHDWGPLPTWQEQEHGYIYSAFLTKQGEAKVLTLLNDEKYVARNCYFWFEDKKKSVIGKFKFSRIVSDDTNRMNLVFYICTLPDTGHVPYAVSFSYKLRKDGDLKKNMLVNSFSHHSGNINTTVCICPSIYSKRRLLEFLSYYKLLGVDSFIFYNRDIPHRIVKIISNLSTSLGLQATFLPWNFPKSDSPITRVAVEKDCVLRVLRQSMYAITLELNEYIVPSHVYSIYSLLQNVNTNSERISLPVQKFCISNVETTKPISMVNNKVSDDYNYNVVRYIYKSDERKEEINTFAIDKGLASIHKYVKCVEEPSKFHTDSSIFKFSSDLSKSTLYQYFLHNQI